METANAMPKRIIWMLALWALVFALVHPIEAKAVVGTTFDTTPSTATPLSLDDSVNLQTTFGLPTNSTVDASMSQTWADGQALMGTVSAPTGWGLEYRVGQSWTSTLPADKLTVSGVRASATGVQTGPGTANGNQAIASASSSVIIADASSINASGRGDGWDVFLTPLYILNVYHHDASYKLECHFRATGNLCDTNAVYQVNGYATGSGSSGTYYRGKAYSLVLHSGKPEMICTNVASLPFTSCGSTILDTGAGSATGNLGTQAFDGQRIWAGNTTTGKLVCFDVTTSTSCGPVPISGLATGGASIPTFSTYIGNKIYTMANKLFCIDPATSTVCSGTWPATVSTGGAQANAIPKRTTAGVVNGVCTITLDMVCFDLTGASVAMPAALNTMLTTAASAVHGGSGYFQTTAWTTTRQYWASEPTGTDWVNGYARCYDWATGAACAGFATNTMVGSQRYAFTIDSGNSNCVWTNGNDGVITNFDGTTGAAGCPVTTTKAAVDFAGLPKYSCNTATSTIRTFQQLQVILAQGSTFNRNNLVVSVIDGNGQAVTGFQNMPLVNGYADLTGLQVSSTTTSFRFVIQSVNNSTYPLSTQDANSMTANLIYEADPVQLCVQLSSVMPVCPAVLNSDTILQPDLVSTTTTSYTIQGQQPVTASQTASWHVNAITKSQCYTWQTFLNTVGGQGVDTGGLGGLVDSIVFGPDNKMYVGGVFTNAGGNGAADYLAVWDGTSWAPVGAVPILSNGVPVLDGQGNPTYSAAITGRVNAIAWTSDNRLLIGGTFQNAGGLANADYFAIYDPNAKTWSAPATPLDGAVNAIVVGSNGTAYLGGGFTGRVNSVNLGTLTWGNMAMLNGVIQTLALNSSGVLYAGGANSGYLKKYDAGTNTWLAVSADPNQSNFISTTVNDIVFNNGKLYAVGMFNGVAVLDPTTDTWSWLGGAANPAGTAHAIAIDASGKVYVGGYFTTANGVNAIDVAMWDGTVWHGFRDARTLSMAMDTSGAIGSWGGAWTVTISPNQVSIWGGDMVNCATRSDLDYLCYFGDKIVLDPNSLNRNVLIDGPAVTWQSTFSEKVEGGTQLTIRGRLLGKTNKVLIGGKVATIVSVTNGEVIVVMPPNLEGAQSLELSFSDQSFKYNATITYKAAAVAAPSAGGRPPVSVTIGGFPDGSPVLSETIKSKINAFLKAHSDYKTITCVGYTEGPTVLKSDYALSKARALNSCSYAQTGLAKTMKLLGIRSGQDLQEAASVRRVVITLTD